MDPDFISLGTLVSAAVGALGLLGFWGYLLNHRKGS